MIDLLYLTWNRLGYTEFTLPKLVENTDWAHVRRVMFYDDNSADGTRRFIQDTIHSGAIPVPCELRVTQGFRSPVRTMLDYLDGWRDGGPAPFFAKIDNDIVVPPGWLPRLLSVMLRFPQLELLGMEAGMAQGLGAAGRPPADPLALKPDQYTWGESSHIGGVGLMRSSAFTGDRPRLKPMGRFGFTEWQHTCQPVRGWIVPDLLTCDLSRCPIQPWVHRSWEYVAKGWERPWPTQDGMDSVYWNWWQAEEAVA